MPRLITACGKPSREVCFVNGWQFTVVNINSWNEWSTLSLGNCSGGLDSLNWNLLLRNRNCDKKELNFVISIFHSADQVGKSAVTNLGIGNTLDQYQWLIKTVPTSYNDKSILIISKVCVLPLALSYTGVIWRGSCSQGKMAPSSLLSL